MYGQGVDELYPLVTEWNPRLKRHELVETEPDACPACGAPWGKPYSMQRGYRECSEHKGHRSWRCRTCDEITVNVVEGAGCR